jgi:hypothetical protein
MICGLAIFKNRSNNNNHQYIKMSTDRPPLDDTKDGLLVQIIVIKIIGAGDRI